MEVMAGIENNYADEVLENKKILKFSQKWLVWFIPKISKQLVVSMKWTESSSFASADN